MRLVTPKGQMSGSNMPPAITGLPASKFWVWVVWHFDVVLCVWGQRREGGEVEQEKEHVCCCVTACSCALHQKHGRM